MSTVYFDLSGGPFSQPWDDINMITADDNWANVPSIVGYLGDDAGTTAAPYNLLTQTSATGGTTPDVIANRTQAQTNISNGGVAEFELVNPTIALQGSGTADFPNIVLYLNAAGRTNIRLTATLRDIDGTADSANQVVNVQYRTSPTSAWINVPGGLTGDLTTGGAATQTTALDLTLPAAAANSPTLEIRIMTGNATGNDEWVGIDDIVVTSEAIPPGPGFLSVSDAVVAEGNAGTVPITFNVTRDAGVDGPVTVQWAVTFAGGLAVADSTDFASGQVFGGTLSWADGEAATKTITLLVQGDTIVEPSEKFTVTLSNVTGGATLSDPTGLGTITNDDSGPIGIYQIQGAAHTSPWTGETVTTTGIVTAVDSNGYYLQDPSGDGNDATSDGIFVFTSGAPTVIIAGTPQPIVVGDSLTVTGTVTEFQASSASLTVTEITGSTAVRNSQGNMLPAAIVIGTGGRLPPTENYEDDNFTSFNPATDALDFYESMEGMRVTIDNPLVVADTNGFGETFVVASGGAGATGVNARKGITVSEGDFNPERIQIDNDANLGPSYDPDHSQGDELGDVTGIMNYAFSFYEVLVTGPVTVTNDVTLGQETTALDGDSTHLTIASYNVENLDPNDPQSKFDAIASQIVNNMSSPDIIGLQEIQDADGADNGDNYSGQPTADKLIAAIAAAGGPTYQYVEIAPTSNSTSNGEPNGNIRNGFLYNPERVTYVPGSAELILGAVASGARYPLVADFIFNGETVTVINVHFTSRGGSEPLMGDNQPPTNGGDSARLTQAQAVRAYIDGLAAGDPELNIVTLGDFNSFYFEAPLQTIQAGGAQNNLHLLLPEEERYTYMFEGNLQALDNILVGPNLNLTSEFDAVHLNAEQRAGTAKPTDHDPTVAEILISANDTISSTSGNDLRRSGAGSDFFYLNQGGDDTASGGDGNDAFYFGNAFTGADKVDGEAGGDVVILQGNYTLTLSATNLTEIEAISLQSGATTFWGDTANAFYDYNITTVEANVASGQQLIINGQSLRVDEDLTVNGTAENDGRFLMFGGHGVDTLKGGGGTDLFVFEGTRWGASDSVDGGAGIDAVIITAGNGLTHIDFGPTSLLGIEALSVNNRFATDPSAKPDYEFVLDDGNVADGATLIVNGSSLEDPDQTISVDGSDEEDGNLILFGGAGMDGLIGGDGDDMLHGAGRGDTLTGGDGNDVFRYDNVTESNLTEQDGIQDFTLGDLIDLSRIDADTTQPGDQAFSFIGNAVFTPGAAGQLRYQQVGTSNLWLIQGETDGMPGIDFQISVLVTDLNPITSSDFIL